MAIPGVGFGAKGKWTRAGGKLQVASTLLQTASTLLQTDIATSCEPAKVPANWKTEKSTKIMFVFWFWPECRRIGTVKNPPKSCLFATTRLKVSGGSGSTGPRRRSVAFYSTPQVSRCFNSIHSMQKLKPENPPKSCLFFGPGLSVGESEK